MFWKSSLKSYGAFTPCRNSEMPTCRTQVIVELFFWEIWPVPHDRCTTSPLEINFGIDSVDDVITTWRDRILFNLKASVICKLTR